MKIEGLVGIVILGVMSVVGIGLIFLDSSMPVLGVIILAGVFSIFVSLEKRKKKINLKSIRKITPDELKNEFRIVAQSAEDAIRTANEIKEDLKLLNRRYVGSVKTKRFHKPECRLARNIKFDNQVWFVNKFDALNQGFRECRTREIRI